MCFQIPAKRGDKRQQSDQVHWERHEINGNNVRVWRQKENKEIEARNR